MAEVKTQGAVEAMEVAEASRETEWEKPSFVGDLFLGKLNLDLIYPFPEQPAADKAEADDFLVKLERFMAEHVDADKIDEQGEYDYELFKGFNELGAWGIFRSGRSMNESSFMRQAEASDWLLAPGCWLLGKAGELEPQRLSIRAISFL